MRTFPFQPMLAATVKDVTKLQFPLIATPKIDGIRAFTAAPVFQRDLCSPFFRSLRPVANEHVRRTMERTCVQGLDGELMVRGDHGELLPFSRCQSLLTTHAGEPNFEFWVFDYLDRWSDPRYARGVMAAYTQRLAMLAALELPDFCKIVPWNLLTSLEDLEKYEAMCLHQGHEGVMLRSPQSPYKFGRSTLNEQWLMKLKRFQEGEAIVIGWEERMSNQGPAKDDPLGRMRRHHYKESMVPTNSLGSLHVRDLKTGLEFRVGTGFSETDRVEIWDRGLKEVAGRVIKYKSQPYGVKERPRIPVFIGWGRRHE